MAYECGFVDGFDDLCNDEVCPGYGGYLCSYGCCDGGDGEGTVCTATGYASILLAYGGSGFCVDGDGVGLVDPPRSNVRDLCNVRCN